MATIQVHPVHFEDYDGKQFERLVFAYHLRRGPWDSLEWYGQVGSDLGRDIWGVREGGSTICIQCANRKRVGYQKAKEAIDAILKGPGGKPDTFRFVCSSNISAESRDKIKGYAVSNGILNCDVWSGVEFEENLRANCESLLKRFVEGVEFPDSSDELSKFVKTDGDRELSGRQIDLYQQFFTLWSEFKNGLWIDDLRNKAEARLRDWLNKNNLYLEPDLREKVRLCLCEVARFPGWRDRNEQEAATYQERVIQISKRIEQAADHVGIHPTKTPAPHFIGLARIVPAEARQGLLCFVVLELVNDGERTARGVRVVVTYGETNCSAASHNDKLWEEVSTGMFRPVNPRNLRARNSLNPQDKVPIFPIPICDRTVFPFEISVEISADDQQPSTITGMIRTPEVGQTITLTSA